MNCRGVEERLDAYVAGALSQRDTHAVEQHVARCGSCRDDLVFLQSLRDEVSELPRSIDPPHDLWPAVARRVRATGDAGHELAASHRLRPRASASARLRPLVTVPAVAAALVLAALSSAMTFVLVRPAVRQAAIESAPPVGAVLTIEDRYRGALEDLTAALDARRAELDPRLARVLEENLRMIEEAIRESRTALAQNPGNVVLTRMLETTYATKLDLLRRATRVASET